VTVLLLDPTGRMAVAGAVHEIIPLNDGSLVVWKPAMPLALGFYRLTITDEWTSPEPIDLQVVEPFSDEPPQIMLEPSTSMIVSASDTACCSLPDAMSTGGTPPDQCFVTRQDVVASVDPGMWSTEPATRLNQYLFRLRPVHLQESDVVDSWLPFELVDALTYYDEKDEYCFELEAWRLSTGDKTTYDGPACAGGVERTLGNFEVEVEDSALERDVCFSPPDAQKDRWCAINERACDDTSADDCAQFRYVCEGGPLPRGWNGVAIGDRDRSSSEGCATVPGARSGSTSAALLLLLALAPRTAHRRNRRRAQ
jgi:hypothetical protein